MKNKIAFIGLGVMGSSMAKNLMKAGDELKVYTRTRSTAESLLSQGAVWCESPKVASENVDFVITMVGYPSDVKEVYFGDSGIIENAKSGTTLIDMSTSSPNLAKRIFEEAQNKNLRALDAPVSGGDVGAKSGTLSIMVGGEEKVFDESLEILEVMGENIVYQGVSGSGQHSKMCNQIVAAGNMMGVVESLVYAKKKGLDPARVMKSIESGAAGSWLLSNLGPRMLKGDFAAGFYVKHFIKDLGIALEEAKLTGFDLPCTSLAKKLYSQFAEQGGQDEGTQALFGWMLEGSR